MGKGACIFRQTHRKSSYRTGTSFNKQSPAAWKGGSSGDPHYFKVDSRSRTSSLFGYEESRMPSIGPVELQQVLHEANESLPSRFSDPQVPIASVAPPLIPQDDQEIITLGATKFFFVFGIEMASGSGDIKVASIDLVATKLSPKPPSELLTLPSPKVIRQAGDVILTPTKKFVVFDIPMTTALEPPTGMVQRVSPVRRLSLPALTPQGRCQSMKVPVLGAESPAEARSSGRPAPTPGEDSSPKPSGFLGLLNSALTDLAGAFSRLMGRIRSIFSSAF